VLDLVFRKWLPEVMGVIVLSAFLAHTGWHWFLDRGAATLEYQFIMPVFDATFVAALLRWLMLGLIALGALWGLRGLYDWVGRRHGGGGEPAGRPAASAPAEPAVS
jgi:hypothetical protein